MLLEVSRKTPELRANSFQSLTAGHTVLCRDGAGGIRLSRTNREISGGTADSGTETEEARSMASRPSRNSPGQSLRIRIVGMSYILIVREIDDRDERRERLAFEIS